MSFTHLSNLLSTAWNKRIVLSLLTLLLFSSCSLLSGSIRKSTESQKDFKERIRTEGLHINSIVVKKGFDSAAVKENAEYALSILVPENTTDPSDKMQADVVLKEESFIKGFKQINTVSLELIIRDRNENILKMILISEETENTLSSYKYLYKILEKGIRETGL